MNLNNLITRRSFKDSKESLAWITGASKGIGRAIAIELASNGWTVAASGRNLDELNSLLNKDKECSGNIYIYPFDITDESLAKETLALIENEHGPISLAILNAGTHNPVNGASLEIGNIKRVINTNLMGTINCLVPTLESFVGRRAGHIAVMTSLAGYRGLPTASAYGATKAALINMCEALRVEVEKSGVVISIISPGFVRTALTDLNSFPMPFLMEPKEAAKRIIRGLESRRFEIAFPRRFYFVMKILRILPYVLFFFISRRIIGKD
jgi:short-subunit dehydrogenase|tara:strand:- start:4590 stop:5393 length:804 start_codon:yes stop_codon:yes gene_type:complete